MGTPPLSPEEIRAAAEVHRELGPEYGDAVVKSFLDKVARHIDAEVDARVARAGRQQAEHATRRAILDTARAELSARQRSLLIGVAIGGGAVGIPLLSLGYWFVSHPFEGLRAYLPVTLAVSGVLFIIYLLCCVLVLARRSERD